MQTESVGVGWSSRLVFLMAAVGASVGLGNIWKFPYVTGANGGGAFVTVYFLAAILDQISPSNINVPVCTVQTCDAYPKTE